jgi:hypothetical protein
VLAKEVKKQNIIIVIERNTPKIKKDIEKDLQPYYELQNGSMIKTKNII